MLPLLQSPSVRKSTRLFACSVKVSFPIFVTCLKMAFASPLSLPPVQSFQNCQVQKCALFNRTIETRTRIAPSHCPVMPATMTVQSPSAFKNVLLETLAPLDFGRAVIDSPSKREEIDQLIRQVEATNTSFDPSADENLSGLWETVYTTSTSVLRIGLPSFLRPIKFTQLIDAKNLFARNEETFKIGPFQFTNAVEAKLTALSKVRFDVDFTQFVVFGFIKINVEKNPNFRGYLDVTYLDDNLRISRGSKGNSFVLVRID